MTESEERFWARVRKSDGCWLWKGPTNVKGYGKTSVNGTAVWAHRYSYTVQVGPIPVNLQIDHLCRVPACVNPQHLEPVTPRENCHRGRNPFIIAHLNNMCLKGLHRLEGSNVRAVSGGRACIACWNARVRTDRKEKFLTDSAYREKVRKWDRDKKNRWYKTRAEFREKAKQRQRARYRALKLKQTG